MSSLTESGSASPTDNKPRRLGGIGFVGSAGLVTMLSSMAAVVVAAALLGISEQINLGANILGGSLALGAMVHMKAKCDSWAYWQKWIPFWAGLSIVLTLIVTNVTYREYSESAPPSPIAESPTTQNPAPIRETVADTGQTCAELHETLLIKARILWDEDLQPGDPLPGPAPEGAGGWLAQSYNAAYPQYIASC